MRRYQYYESSYDSDYYKEFKAQRLQNAGMITLVAPEALLCQSLRFPG
jgi:hypothetical protein